VVTEHRAAMRDSNELAHPKRIQVAPDLCRDCQACTLACSLYHEGECSLSLARLVVSKDMARYEFHIAICQQCDSPDCIPACPTGAMRRSGRGVVVLAEDECTQCGACADSCPFGAVFCNEAQGRYLKCDLCAGREEGPLCAEVCPVGALTLCDATTEVEA
jgi:Fe-S-cluster-containing hydrogenase component 2